jgi:hypothetical protein
MHILSRKCAFAGQIKRNEENARYGSLKKKKKKRETYSDISLECRQFDRVITELSWALMQRTYNFKVFIKNE